VANKCILILGGARSGKSGYAQELADIPNKSVVFAATAEPLDEEMKVRIEKHKNSRPATWRTVELPTGLGMTLDTILSGGETIIVDCITLLVSNIMGKHENAALAEDDVIKEISELIDCMQRKRCTFIIVSNEVGLGIVPDNDLARAYRDILGKANRMLAQYATDVYFMTAGIPFQIKKMASS